MKTAGNTVSETVPCTDRGGGRNEKMGTRSALPWSSTPYGAQLRSGWVEQRLRVGNVGRPGA